MQNEEKLDNENFTVRKWSIGIYYYEQNTLYWKGEEITTTNIFKRQKQKYHIQVENGQWYKMYWKYKYLNKYEARQMVIFLTSNQFVSKREKWKLGG